MRISDLKARAKESLKTTYGTYLLISFIAIIIMSTVGSFGIFAVVVTGPISVGLSYAFLKLARQMEGDVQDMFFGFNAFVPSFVMQLLSGIFIFLWSLLFIVPGIIKAFAYAMAPYILADNPEMSGLDAITASKNMMMGHKGRLFGLCLSFFGWFLLCCLTFGIGFIFLAPWVRASITEFYQDLLDQKAAA